MDSQASAAVAPQQVSGQSAFWILVSLALAAVTQPSIDSRRKERRMADGSIDLLRSFPGTCLLDGIIDVVVMSRAMRDAWYTRSPPLAANVVTTKLTIWMLAVLPQAIKVFSMRGIPVTQFCAACYFFAVTTKLMVEFSRLETDRYYPYETSAMATALFIILFFLAGLGQLALEGLIWYSITCSTPISQPRQLKVFRDWFTLIIFPLVILQIMLWVIRYPFKERFNGSDSGPYAVPVFACYVLFTVTGIGIGRKAELVKMSENTGASIAPAHTWTDDFSEAFNRSACVFIVSCLVAKAIGVLGNLIARSGHSPSRAPATPDLRLPGQTLLHSRGGDLSLDPGPDAEDSTDSNEAYGPRLMRLLRTSMTWTLSLGSRIDRPLGRFLKIELFDTTLIAITIFNLLTTIFYYLLLFDGTGTESPNWVSYLG